MGSVQPVELIMEKGRRFESNEVLAVTVADLAMMNLHVTTGRKLRSRIMIDGLQPNQGWWFMACDSYSWKALEEGTGYRCTKKVW